MSPGVVLGMLAGLGGSVDRVVVVGCEPATLDEGIGLSPAVAAAVEPAVELCRGLLTEMTEPLAKDAPG
jgi:hydrogenase maturation protease